MEEQAAASAPSPLDGKFGATVRGVGLGVAGIVSIFVFYFVIGSIAQGLVIGEMGLSLRAMLSTLASGAGTLAVVALYLGLSDRDLSYLDVRMPDLRGLGYVVAGTVTILVGNLAIGLAFQRAGVESASHTIIQTAEADPSILLALVPLSYLLIAPGEELLYRNVVQKLLREWYSPVAGVVVASAIFAAVHLPAYSSPGASFEATLSTLAVVFVLALVLGAVYERTGNVVVSILVHGTFNAIAFAVTYARLTGALG
jgi:membrane protease YdiL (CAAX protease family)